jgi:hypothetical protein
MSFYRLFTFTNAALGTLGVATNGAALPLLLEFIYLTVTFTM